MEVDVSDAHAFSAAASSKGKRIAADLPVELSDNLPWYVAC